MFWNCVKRPDPMSGLSVFWEEFLALGFRRPSFSARADWRLVAGQWKIFGLFKPSGAF